MKDYIPVLIDKANMWMAFLQRIPLTVQCANAEQSKFLYLY